MTTSTKIPKVRRLNVEIARYTEDNPHPEWESKGERWVDYALMHWKKGESFNVAYIPHVPLRIEVDSKKSKVAPTFWDREESDDVYNLAFGPNNNKFRLNARNVKQPSGILGSPHPIDMDPSHNGDVILDLLKLAEIIYEPPA